MSFAAAPRPARRHRRAGHAFASLVAAAGLVVTLAACARVGEPAPVPETAVECGRIAPVRAPELCHTIHVGGAVYRYGLLARAHEAPRALVVVDRGGPGNSALAASVAGWAVSSLGMREPPPGIGFLEVEEPWVTRPVPAGACADSSSAYVGAVRAGALPHSVVEAMKRHCAHHEYGWSPARYRDVVAAISARHGAPVTAFVGSSFGAYRLAWLRSDPRLGIRSAILANPLLPELSAETVLLHQADAIARLRTRLGDSRGEVTAGELLAAAASQLAGTAMPAGSAPEPLDADRLRALASTYLGSFGDGQLSLGRLAYFQELCAAGFFVSGGHSWNGALNDPYGFLAAAHGGCPSEEPPRHGIVDSDLTLCLSMSTEDSVVPFAAIQPLLGRIRHHVVNGPHHDTAALRHCRDVVPDAASRAVG